MRLRLLAAAAAVTALPLMLGGVAASASSTVPAALARQAAHARTMRAAPRVTESTFSNGNNLYIVGDSHGEDLLGGGFPGTIYYGYLQVGNYYTFSANKLCWNTLGGAGDGVGMDSCPNEDTNEWFEPDVIGAGTIYLRAYNTGLCLWGAGIGKALVLEECSSTNPRDIWSQNPQ
jgi:hypothetical protein